MLIPRLSWKLILGNLESAKSSLILHESIDQNISADWWRKTLIAHGFRVALVATMFNNSFWML